VIESKRRNENVCVCERERNTNGRGTGVVGGGGEPKIELAADCEGDSDFGCCVANSTEEIE
jgi:hypothetical protein